MDRAGIVVASPGAAPPHHEVSIVFERRLNTADAIREIVQAWLSAMVAHSLPWGTSRRIHDGRAPVALGPRSSHVRHSSSAGRRRRAELREICQPIPPREGASVSLTEAEHLFAGLHETGANDLLHAFFTARPHHRRHPIA